MDKFYCCFVEGTGGFSHKHLTLEEAKKEAIRLAEKTSRIVFVLEAISYCQIEYPPVVFHQIEEGAKE